VENHHFEIADIAFTITTDKNSFLAESLDLLIQPEVSIADNTLHISHPDYKGTFSLTEQKGTVWVSSQMALNAVQRTITTVLIVRHGGLALHSSCILKNQKAHIFAGASGSGKSTIVQLTDEPMLYSDEMTLVKKNDEGVFTVYHSPFRSDHQTSPLPPTDRIAGVFFLRQDTASSLEPIPQSTAIFKLLPVVFFPVKDRNPYEQTIFNLCCDFLEQVPTAVLSFKKDSTFWRCISD
jgi:hypothetical protein